MRVLLDEQLPRHLAREIVGHDTSTVQQRGWAGLKNGELLRVAADAGFDVLVTADRNLQFQQNLSQSQLGIILLVASSNALEDLVRSCQICSPLFRRAAPASCYA
jgi:predicted nuclease of predicted toxin-antitoxin system